MSEKGFFASICGFFSSLFSSEPAQESSSTSPAPAETAQPSASKQNDGLTGVERYIRRQAENAAKPMTSVERYIRNQAANAKPLTGVERYIRNKASAEKITSVERYIRNLG